MHIVRVLVLVSMMILLRQLEDGGGPGTGGSHWEMRLFRDEYMTGTASPGASSAGGVDR